MFIVAHSIAAQGPNGRGGDARVSGPDLGQ